MNLHSAITPRSMVFAGTIISSAPGRFPIIALLEPTLTDLKNFTWSLTHLDFILPRLRKEGGLMSKKPF
jgi:hypothetical protein